MWPFKPDYTEQTDKPLVELKPCIICGNENVSFSSKPSEYFNYFLEIKCEKCNFLFQKHGEINQCYTPENYKKDWDDFIKTWNK
jgi:hypothetical protein